ncbi:MAG: ATP-binding protein [Chryseolinea sp.]
MPAYYYKSDCRCISPLSITRCKQRSDEASDTSLISNALKFTKQGVTPKISIQSKELNAKEIGLSLTDHDAYCRIVIKDNGIGFNESYSSSVFSLFEKLNPKSSFEGSGIGLAIAKKIIDKHHGMIIAKSKEGVGSEFNIIISRRRIT